MKKIALVAILALIAGSPEALAQSLTDALISAYKNNPTLLAQRASLRAVDEKIPQALSNWRPAISASSDLTRKISRNNTRNDGEKRAVRSPRGFGITVTQPLFRGFRTNAAVSSAENAIKAARNRLLNVEQQTLLDAVTSYMSVVQDQAILKLNIGNQQVLRRQLEAAKDRFEVGEITKTDVSQAKARLSGATADRIQAEGALEISRETYLSVIGAVPGKLVRPTQDFTDLPEHKNAALNLAEKNHPTVRSAIYEELSARDKVKDIKGELLPTLALNGTISYRNEQTTDTGFSTERSVGAILTVPLYQSGSVYSRIRQAKQTAGQQRRLVVQARRTTQKNASQAWQTLLTARARIVSFNAQVEANKIALEGVQREAAVGSRTVLDILDAEQELLDSKVNLVGAQRDETVAVFSVKSTTGQLTAEQLNLKVDVYDPFKHYHETRGKWFGTQTSGQIQDTPAP